jgi:hypothetical protein
MELLTTLERKLLQVEFGNLEFSTFFLILEFYKDSNFILLELLYCCLKVHIKCTD